MSDYRLLPRTAPDSMELHGNTGPILEYIENSNFGGRLKDVSRVLTGGRETHWLEYVPSCYTGQTPVPLVLSMHAGGQSSYGQFYDTAWNTLAETENFLVAYPDALRNGAWGVNESGSIDKSAHDMQAILALIEDLAARYNIDRGRIYMQGMSMGDLMSMQCGRAFGNILAGIGCCSGPTDPDLLFSDDGSLRENTGPVPVFQSRGVYDTIALNPKFPRPLTNVKNREFWRILDGCREDPAIQTTASEIIAVYPGEMGDVVYRNMVRHGHYQAVNDAQLAWDLVFSRFRRNEDGTLTRIGTDCFVPDKNAAALVDGSEYAYINNKKVKIGGRALIVEAVQQGPPMPAPGEGPAKPDGGPAPRGKPGPGAGKMPGPGEEKPMPAMAPGASGEVSGVYVYVPAAFLSAFGADVTLDGDHALVCFDGKTLEFAKGSAASLVDGRIFNMGMEARLVDGMLYLPLSWFAEEILGWTCSVHQGAAYLKNGPVTVTEDFSRILKEILA